MSNFEFDQLSGQLTRIIRPKDEGADSAVWAESVQRLLRQVFRAGFYAKLDRGYGAIQDDPALRLRWLANRGLFNGDVEALLTEVENWREKDQAFTGMYGLTESDLHSMLGEGFHTAFRKATDSPYAAVIHKLIKDMPPEEWRAVIDFVTGPVIDWLRRAEAEQKKKETTP